MVSSSIRAKGFRLRFKTNNKLVQFKKILTYIKQKTLIIKMKKLIMVGAGGHAKSCLDVIESTKRF